MKSKYDIAIIGGGLVGSVMAIALAQLNFKVALIEANAPIKQAEKDPRDDRAIVLSYGSKNILESLGLWSYFESYTTPIKKIHVSDRGHFGKVRIDAAEENVDALGYVVLAYPLGVGISEGLKKYPDHITTIYQAKFQDFEDDFAQVVVDVNGEKQIIKTDLVIASDGSNSPVRHQLNIETEITDYHQRVVIAQIELEKNHDFTAYERFTANGPLALLPQGDKTAALIWSASPDDAKKISQLNSKDFIERLQNEFGYSLGEFKNPTKPYVFPLQLIQAKSLGTPGVILVGNSAHTLHPIAGQGLNLGLRDVALLAELLFDCRNAGKPINDEQFLQQFTKMRISDHENIIHLTHGLVGMFSNAFIPAIVGRNIGLSLMDRIPFLKSKLAQSTMGFSGKNSKLASNIPIKEWCYDETI